MINPRFRIRIPPAHLGAAERDLEPMRLNPAGTGYEVEVPPNMMARFRNVVGKYKCPIDHVDYGDFQASDLASLASPMLLDQYGPVRAYKKHAVTRAVQVASSVVILMKNGPARAEPGDYICEDAQGDLYVCTRGIFESTYERVN